MPLFCVILRNFAALGLITSISWRETDTVCNKNVVQRKKVEKETLVADYVIDVILNKAYVIILPWS